MLRQKINIKNSATRPPPPPTHPGGGAGANKYFDCCVDGSLYSNYKRLLYDQNKNQYVDSFK
jgi:hypothetical protein